MQIHTVQMAQWRKVIAMDLTVTDVTVKSGIKEFAPDWDFLTEYKSSPMGPEDEARYTEKFLAKMNRIHNESPETWTRYLTETVPLVLACYCKAGCFCHRHLLVECFRKLCAAHTVPFEYLGEII